MSRHNFDNNSSHSSPFCLPLPTSCRPLWAPGRLGGVGGPRSHWQARASSNSAGWTLSSHFFSWVFFSHLEQKHLAASCRCPPPPRLLAPHPGFPGEGGGQCRERLHVCPLHPACPPAPRTLSPPLDSRKQDWAGNSGAPSVGTAPLARAARAWWVPWSLGLL